MSTDAIQKGGCRKVDDCRMSKRLLAEKTSKKERKVQFECLLMRKNAISKVAHFHNMWRYAFPKVHLAIPNTSTWRARGGSMCFFQLFVDSEEWSMLVFQSLDLVILVTGCRIFCRLFSLKSNGTFRLISLSWGPPLRPFYDGLGWQEPPKIWTNKSSGR